MLSHQEVLDNAESYMKQFFKVVDRQRTEVRWQSEWFQEFRLKDVIALTRRFTVAQLTAREDFARRLAAGRPVAVTELLYPLLQAYDSVMIQADVEFGGTDQKFNCLVGRDLQAMEGQRPQQVFLVPILTGTDGKQKMSKSLGNYIGVDDPPQEMFGKVMSIPDDLILSYFELLTDVPDEELREMAEAVAGQGVNPMELKMRLGEEIVGQFHSEKAAQEARNAFVHVFQRREVPEDVPVASLPVPQSSIVGETIYVPFGDGRPLSFQVVPNGYKGDTVGTLSALGLTGSKSEAKRLVEQGAVEVDGVKVTGRDMTVRDGSVIKVGKQRFLKLVERQEG
jgi:tyrosyl-tRNA synthetase